MPEHISPLGFYVPTILLLDHFAAVMEHLDPAQCEVVTRAKGPEADAIHARCTHEGRRIRNLEDMVRRNERFAALVSNHPEGEDDCPICKSQRCEHQPNGIHAIQRIADRQVRFLYALGKLEWNLRPWNEIYDMILVFGPAHANAFRRFKRPRIVEMGYPRYDRLIRGEIDVDALKRRLGLDPLRETLVWLPTWDATSSIDLYAEALAELSSRYNVVVKPHPHTMTHEPARVDLLGRLPFTAFVREPLDSVEFIALADTVIADYGGSAFGALYADRRLLLLNVPGAKDDATVGAGSFDLALRQSIENIDPHRAGTIASVLDDGPTWGRQQVARRLLRDQLFAPFYGFSGEVTATILRNLDRAFDSRHAAQTPAPERARSLV